MKFPLYFNGRKSHALAWICALSMSGCTTMKAIQQSGDDFSKGNIVSGVWNGTMGVAMSAIYDVVTLGGNTDAATGSKAIIAAKNGDYSPAYTALNVENSQSGSSSNATTSMNRDAFDQERTAIAKALPTSKSGSIIDPEISKQACYPTHGPTYAPEGFWICDRATQATYQLQFYISNFSSSESNKLNRSQHSQDNIYLEICHKTADGGRIGNNPPKLMEGSWCGARIALFGKADSYLSIKGENEVQQDYQGNAVNLSQRFKRLFLAKPDPSYGGPLTYDGGTMTAEGRDIVLIALNQDSAFHQYVNMNLNAYITTAKEHIQLSSNWLNKTRK